MAATGIPLRILSACSCVLLCTVGCSPEPGTEANVSSPGAAKGAASPWFEDITTRSSVHFVHVAGTNYFMPDQVGAGIVVLDCDNDQRLDLYFVQNGPDRGALNQLFRQEPDQTFRDVSADSGLAVTGRGMGAIAGDVNNDGLSDILITEYGATRLFRSVGDCRFREVTATAGIDNPRWAVPASFLDFDRDGWLDIVVGNYLDYDPTQICHDVHGRRDFCAPQAFGPTVTRLWRNITTQPGADPRFEEVTESSGLIRTPGVALGILCADLTGDGWVDIFCADDGRPNRLFVNQQNGTFLEEAIARGLALNALGRTAGNMGIGYADVDDDGLGDLFITHLTEEFHSLFRQDRRGLFIDGIATAGLQDQGWRGTGFGAVLTDFDADGAADLAFVNGLVRRAVPAQSPVDEGVSPWWARYAQRAQLFANRGGGRFEDVSEQNPAFCGLASVGRSLVVADLDADGAPDLIVGGVGGPVRLYRNIAPRRGHWIRLKLMDPRLGGRDAIGAEVVIVSGTHRRWGLLQPASSFCSSHEPAIHVGLGDSATIDAVEVYWPDGDRETFTGVGVDRGIVLHKGSGKAAEH